MWWRREAVCGLPFYISEPLMWSVFRFAYAQSQAWRSLRCVGLITETKRTGKTQYSRKGSFEGGLSPKESDKTAGPLGTRVFTVHRRFCRYFLTPTKQITTKLVFVVSDHYGFVVISVFCRLYLQLTELRESRHEPLSTSLCLIEKIKKQMDGFRGPP